MKNWKGKEDSRIKVSGFDFFIPNKIKIMKNKPENEKNCFIEIKIMKKKMSTIYLSQYLWFYISSKAFHLSIHLSLSLSHIYIYWYFYVCVYVCVYIYIYAHAYEKKKTVGTIILTYFTIKIESLQWIYYSLNNYVDIGR